MRAAPRQSFRCETTTKIHLKSCAIRPLQRLLKPHRPALSGRHNLPLPHHLLAPDDRPGRPARHLLAIIGRPAAARSDPAVLNHHAPVQINDREIGVIANSNAPLAGDAKEPRRARARHINEMQKREPPLVHMIEHDRHEGLDAGHAGRALRIGLCFFFQSVRRMVGAENVGNALRDREPEVLAMAPVPNRRIHLHHRAEPRIIIRAEGQMMRRHLDARDVLMRSQEIHLPGAGGMQHMNEGTLLARDAQEPLRRAQRHKLVAPDGMRGSIARNAQVLALIEAKLVLAVEGGAPPGLAEDRGNSRIIRNQQRAGRGAHEDLDSGGSRQPFELWNIAPVLMGAADPEGEVAMHAALRARDLVFERRGIRGQGEGVRHLEDGGDPSEDRRAGARLEIFLVRRARLAKMHLGVDDTWQDVKAGGADGLSGIPARKIPDFGDLAAPDADIARADSGMVNHRAPLQDHVEAARHWRVPYKNWLAPCWSGLIYEEAGWKSRAWMNGKVSILRDRGVIEVAGAEAAPFLQRLITNSVLNIPQGESRFSGLLTPQGKLMFDFFVVPLPEEAGAGYLFDCVRAQAPDLAKRLNLHKLRAKITIEDKSAQLGVAAVFGGGPPEGAKGTIYRDMRAPGMGLRLIAPHEALAGLDDAGEEAYEAHRVAEGVPKGGVDFAYGDVFVHDVNLDVMNGVDFKKGCYVGQEVVARVHFRKSARKRILKIRFGGPAPAAGTQVMAGETNVGQIGSTAGEEGLAALRLDRLEEARAAGAVIKAGDAIVDVTVPPELLAAASGVEKRL